MAYHFARRTRSWQEERMMTITRVGPLSVAKIAGLLYTVIGVIVGAMFSLVAMAGAAFGAHDGNAAMFSALFGVGSIVFFPILYGCLGFVMSLIMAALFNFAAGLMGGVEIEAR
jgi:hypothetical protein